MEKEILREIEPFPDAVLFIELWAYTEDNDHQPQALGWTLISLFDFDGQLMTGKFKLPFYPQDFSPSRLLNEESLPYIGNQALYVRICLPLDPVLDNNSLILIENEYHVPEIHLHKASQTITLSEQFSVKDKIYNSNINMGEPAVAPAFNDPRVTKSQFTPNQLSIRSTKKLSTIESTENTPMVAEKADAEPRSRPRL